MPPPVAKVSLPIRRPAAEVFNAFVDPAQLTRFWLNSASAPLTPGASVRWEFMVPGAADTITVRAVEPHRRIAFDWSDGSSVELRFEARADGSTTVSVEAGGFSGEDPVAEALNNTEGFSLVLCDLKTLLESGRSAGLVRDKAALIAAAG